MLSDILGTRGSCERCEEQDAYFRNESGGDVLCGTCMSITNNILLENEINKTKRRGSRFKIISKRQFEEHEWWYYGAQDQEQPISNGQWGFVIDFADTEGPKTKDIILYMIICGMNDGDYTIIDMTDVQKRIKEVTEGGDYLPDFYEQPQ